MGRGTASADIPSTQLRIRSHAEGWPERSLRRVPDLEEADRLAAAVRHAVWGLDERQPLPQDLTPLVRAGRFILKQRDLAAASGGPEALITPLPDGRMRICVDSEPKGSWGDTDPELKRAIARQRTRFRVGHEVAHSFFYDRREGRSRRRHPANQAEEVFCDRFASSLLVPRGAVAALSPKADSILCIHEHFDVSVEVAARAFADTFSEFDVALAFEAEDGEGLLGQWATDPFSDDPAAAIAAAAAGGDQLWESVDLARLPRPRRQLVAVGSAFPQRP